MAWLRSFATELGFTERGRAGSLRPLVSRAIDRAARVRLENLFLAIALAWGNAQVFLVPPLQVPDEGDHWFRAWAITDGQLTTGVDGRLTLPGTFAPLAGLYGQLVS